MKELKNKSKTTFNVQSNIGSNFKQNNNYMDVNVEETDNVKMNN